MADTEDLASMGPRRRRRYLAQHGQAALGSADSSAPSTPALPQDAPLPQPPTPTSVPVTPPNAATEPTPRTLPSRRSRKEEPDTPSFPSVASGVPQAADATWESLLQDTQVAPAEQPEVTLSENRRRDKRSRIRRRKTMRNRTFVILAIVVALVVVAIVFGAIIFNRWLSAKGADYEGSGTGQVMVTVPEGALGSDIGNILAKAQVVASSQAFFNACRDQEAACSAIQPGTYAMAKHMSAVNALSILIDKANRVDDQITIGPGLTKWQVKEQLVTTAGFSDADVEAAFANAPGLPKVAGGDIEGWLAPGTYLVGPGQDATETIRQMVAASVKRLRDAGIPEAQWETFLTKASIVQREGSDLQKQDYGKIARVLENRMDASKETVGFLNMDSTVIYGLGEASKSRKIPTAAEVADASNPYNTYRHKGLPPSPIGVVGQDAFDGTRNPPSGDWLYFTTVDLNTGETRFSATMEEQEANVELLKQFCKDHPDICKG